MPLAPGLVVIVLWIVWTAECAIQCCHCLCALCSNVKGKENQIEKKYVNIDQ